MGELRTTLFDLRLTLESGQFFRYSRHGDEYLLLTRRKAVLVSQRGNRLKFEGDGVLLKELFQLDAPYEAQMRRLRQDPVLAPILSQYLGLRLMRQDLHETIIGFICSSQSNIPKIRMNLHLMANNCGEFVDGHAYLPAPGKDLDHATVLAAKTGYRAKFIVASNKLLTDEFLQNVQEAEYGLAHELLCALPGVGPKIADCICLFALGHGEAFPVDVHIARAMRTLFPKARLTDERRIKYFAQQRWGKDAGLAQQFIFQWARDNLDAKSEQVKRKVIV